MPHLPRFFLPQEAFPPDMELLGRPRAETPSEYRFPEISITGSDAAHLIKSLRAKPGEELTVSDMRRSDYRCRIAEISESLVRLEILSVERSENEPSAEVILFQAIPKGDKMDGIISRAVELGVRRIVPVITARTIVKGTTHDFERKRLRWQRIADEAAKQCGRGELIPISETVGYNQALEQLILRETAFICYEGEETSSIRDFLEQNTLTDTAFLIGPEGGLAPVEADAAVHRGIKLISLGRRILRTETASACVLSAIMLMTNNL